MKNIIDSKEFQEALKEAIKEGDCSEVLTAINEALNRFLVEDDLDWKVGDKITITDCRHGHFFKIGEIVEIIYIDDDDNIPYQCNKNGNYWWISKQEGVKCL